MNSELVKLPVIPLRELVLFPGVGVPLHIGRPATLEAVKAALERPEHRVFTVLQTSKDDEVTPEILHTIGTVAEIARIDQSSGSVQLLLQAERRGTAVRYDAVESHLEASVAAVVEIPPQNPRDPLFLALEKELKERAAELGKKAGIPEAVIRQALESVDDHGRLTDLVASYLELTVADKQSLLETLSIEERMRRILVHVQRQISVLNAQAEIQSKVKRELGDRQREMVLREQMKQIQKELGDEDGGDLLEALRQRIDALELPPPVRKEIDRDLRRLTGMSQESMEAQVLRTYLETVAELPWGKRSEDQLDIQRAATILDEDHYGLADVKDRILEYLAVLRLKTRDAAAPKLTKGPILLFTGPPGVGKTSVARSIARALGREYVRISLGGARDEADIRGHRRTYVGAMPGRIIQGMRQAGTSNPVFLLDEVDKLGISFQGDPSSALLEVLDPAQNDSFVDHYLGVPFDLSEVLFVATANFAQNIPAPLLDRMEVVEFTGYTEREKLEIARRHLLPRLLDAHGLTAAQIEFPDEAIAQVVTYYTREAGVRQLEKELGKLCRKIARAIAAGDSTVVALDAKRVAGYLGKPRMHPERASPQDRVGVATGLFYTPVGGDIMFVEVTTMRGKGDLVLTGQLGDVMKESARAVWSYARSHAAEFLIDPDMFDRDVHIHVPAGAIPKEGPSAGVALATALISALSEVPARHDLAMTGEVTLTGRVLPIGGVKEKVLGAVRAGIRTIILPKENEADLADLPRDIVALLEVHPVERLDEVLEIALPAGVFRRDGALAG